MTVISFSCDTTDRSSVTAALEQVVTISGRLDGVVHNATSGRSPVPSVFADLPLSELRDHLAVPVRGTYLLAARPPW